MAVLECLLFALLALQEIEVGVSEQCYGGLQNGTLNSIGEIALPSMQGALYVYTEPLADSTCKLGGRLKQLNFCFLAQLTNATSDAVDPVFTIALLEDNGFGYVARYVHKEREDRRFCLRDYESSFCCKWIDVIPPQEVNPSYALAVLTSTELADNGFIYEVRSSAPGFIADGIEVITEGREVENLERSDAAPIPQLALTLVLETEFAVTLDFLNNYLQYVGGILTIVSLLLTMVSILFLTGLYFKFKRLQKYLRNRPRPRPVPIGNSARDGQERGSNYAEIKDYIQMLPSPAVIKTFELPTEENPDAPYANIAGPNKSDSNYTEMLPQRPEDSQLKRKPSLVTTELRKIKLQYGEPQNCVPMLEPLESDPNNFQPPPVDELSLYEQCSQLNLKNIPRDSITLGDELGKGQFGKVLKGMWSKSSKKKFENPDNDNPNNENVRSEDCQEVAVKMLKDDSTPGATVKFLREAVIMGQFHSVNVVKLFGVVIAGNPKMLILELLSSGDLLHVLKDLHPFNTKNGVVDDELPHTLLSYCRQVATGMTHLSGKGFIHRDLAARNILVSEGGVCKIADFGMARDLMDDNYYKTKGGRIPVRWTAPEALNYRKFSAASDVWSYGIVMYEIWSLGRQPYEGQNKDEVIALVSAGVRLAPPPGCPRAIYSIMIKAWHSEPSSRPSFDEISELVSISDAKILKPGVQAEEESKDPPKFPSLGSTLASSEHLFKDLQQAYLSS